jgi:hypothetical protein
MNLRASKHGSTRPRAWFSCRVSVLVGSLVLLSYVLSYVHLALCSHAIADVSGKVVHSSESSSTVNALAFRSLSHEVTVRSGHSQHSDDECKILPFLKQGVVLPQAPALSAEWDLFVAAGVEQRIGIELPASRLFRIAPSRSPPSLV